MYCHFDPVAPGDMATVQRWRAPNRAGGAKQADEGWHGAQGHRHAAGPQGKKCSTRDPRTVKIL